MMVSRNFFLAWRMFGRDWRAGELRLLLVALVIAVGAATTISFFTERVTRALSLQSAELLGADLVLTSPQPVESEWLTHAVRMNLQSTPSLRFASVVLRGAELQLASVTAVSPGYPARGTLRTAPAPFVPDAPATGVPDRGEAWADTRLVTALGAKVGAQIDIGQARFTITRILTYEPGRRGAWSSLAPRVLINEADVSKTEVIQPGSRVNYSYHFAGPEQGIRMFREWLEPRLAPNHNLYDARTGNRSVGTALERTELYLGLASLIAVLLAGVAIAMGAWRYSERHFDVSAMLRCFGASQRDLAYLYIPQLLAIALLAGVAGCAVGWIAQAGVFYLLQDLLPAQLPAAGPKPIVVGFFTAVIALAGFALPPIMRLKHVPPLRVLRRDLTPLPPSGWLVYGAALAAMLVLMWRYTGDWRLTSIVLGGAGGAAVVLAFLAVALLRVGRTMHRHVGVAWRFGINNLWRRTGSSVSQMLAFGLTLTAMALTVLVRSDLLSTWQAQLPVRAPNHFAFNILPDQVEPLRQFFTVHGIESSRIYPIVRGRLTAINGVPAREVVTEEAREVRAVQRELNLTWSAVLPDDNFIAAGAWWPDGPSTKTGVSVEARLAERLGIKLGDALSFSVAGQALNARVTSLRTVQWESFRPNFFMIFSPGSLDAHPATYLVSFFLVPQQKPLLRDLVHQFPAVTVLDIDFVLAQARALLRQVAVAVEFVLLFVLCAGFSVLYAALRASLDERLYEGALLRTLGASRRQLRASHFGEFAALGVMAGVLAAIATEVVAYLLYTRVFNLDYVFKWPVWLLAPLVGGLLVGFAGYRGARPAIQRSPLAVLRDL